MSWQNPRSFNLSISWARWPHVPEVFFLVACSLMLLLTVRIDACKVIFRGCPSAIFVVIFAAILHAGRFPPSDELRNGCHLAKILHLSCLKRANGGRLPLLLRGICG